MAKDTGSVHGVLNPGLSRNALEFGTQSGLGALELCSPVWPAPRSGVEYILLRDGYFNAEGEGLHLECSCLLGEGYRGAESGEGCLFGVLNRVEI